MVKSKSYIPDIGEIVWLNFNPQTGHEQMGRRPALVISPKAYNEKTNLAIFCPITSQIKNYPFEVEIPSNSEITGVILSDQVKSLDWKAREVKFICVLPIPEFKKVINKINVLINLQ